MLEKCIPAQIQIHTILWYNEGESILPDIKTILARDIETENLDIRYDMSVKRVLGNIPLLAPITKYTVKELKDFSIPMIEQCIDADSIQISQIFVEPGLTNRKIVNDELESKVPCEGWQQDKNHHQHRGPAEKQSRLQPPEPWYLLRGTAYLSPAFRGIYQRRLRQGAVRQYEKGL